MLEVSCYQPYFRPGNATLCSSHHHMTTGLDQLTGYAKVLFDNQPIRKEISASSSRFPEAQCSSYRNGKTRPRTGIVVIGSHPENTRRSVRPDTPPERKCINLPMLSLTLNQEKGDAIALGWMVSPNFASASVTPAPSCIAALQPPPLKNCFQEELHHRYSSVPMWREEPRTMQNCSRISRPNITYV